MGAETSDQPEGAESICEGQAFQDGRSTPSTGSDPSRGLDGETRFERCLPPNPYPSRSSEISGISVGRQVLSVHLPCIWSISSSKSIYQATQTHSRFSEADRMLPDHLPGRHSNSSPGQQPAAANYSLSLPAVRTPGLVSEQQEVSVNTLPTAGIPGISAVHYDTENIYSLRKDEKDSAGCYSNYNLRASSVKRCSQVCWKGSGHSPGLSHSSIALQGITNCNEFSPPSLPYTGGHREEIQLINQNQCGEQGRSCMVESP